MKAQTAMKRGESLRHQEAEQIPERSLAVAVLHLALADLKAGKLGSLLWWQWPSEGLNFWCEVLGLDPDLVRERALAGDIGQPGQRIRSGKYRDRQKPKPEPPEQLELVLGD